MAALLPGLLSSSQSGHQPLPAGVGLGWSLPRADDRRSCSCRARGGFPSPAAACRDKEDTQHWVGGLFPQALDEDRPYLCRVEVLELRRGPTTTAPAAASRASCRGVWHTEGHVRAPLHVEAHQLLQGCCLDYLKASCSAKGTGLPVLRGADGVSEKPLQGKGSSDLHHAFSENAVGLGFLKQQAQVKLQRVDVSIELLQLCSLLLLSCTR